MKFFVSISVFCLALNLLGQINPSGDNGLYIRSPDGSALPPYFSGTNCNVAAGAQRLSPSTAVWVELKLTLSGGGISEVVCHRFYGGPRQEPSDANKGVGLRFASTHFNDGTLVEFKLEAKDSTGQWFSKTETSTMYNKGLVLATKEEYSQNPNNGNQYEYWVPSPPLNGGYAPMSQSAASDALGKLSAMKHTVLNGSSSYFLRETDLASNLKESTAFFACTHGEPSNFRSSEIDQLHFNFVAGQTSEVRSYTHTNRGNKPHHNLVVMHACCTLNHNGNGQWHASYAFGVTLLPGILIDRAYAGFTNTVWSLNVTTNVPLDLHAKKIYESLAAGKTIAKAVELANNEYVPTTNGSLELNMIIRGDNYTRLINVYDPVATPTTSWYLLTS